MQRPRPEAHVPRALPIREGRHNDMAAVELSQSLPGHFHGGKVEVGPQARSVPRPPFAGGEMPERVPLELDPEHPRDVGLLAVQQVDRLEHLVDGERPRSRHGRTASGSGAGHSTARVAGGSRSGRARAATSAGGSIRTRPRGRYAMPAAPDPLHHPIRQPDVMTAHIVLKHSRPDPDPVRTLSG